MKPSRTLVLIVVREVRERARALLDAVPPELFARRNLTFLVIDDASRDSTAEQIVAWSRENHASNLVAWRNPVRQSHGGNQKLALRYAIDEGFEHVVVFPGDGHSSPSALIKVLSTIEREPADVALFTPKRGNRLNRQTSLRAYATSFLKRVPFELNTNEAHFDTEILLQAEHVGAKVSSTSVASEKYRRSWKTWFAASRAFLQYRCHQLGFFCSLKYHRTDSAAYHDKRRVAGSTHFEALREIERLAPERVLDLGCSDNHVADSCEKLGAAVTGIDVAPPKKKRGEFFLHDLESGPLPVEPSDFGVILMLDVVEHLSRPEAFLLSLRNQMESEKPSTIVLSTPNVAFFLIRLNLLIGRFNYAEKGILDITHRRLFTLDSLTTMLVDCGYTIDRVSPIGVPAELFVPGLPGKTLGALSRLAARLWSRAFAFQFLVVCRPKPGARHLLKSTIPVVTPSPKRRAR